MTLYSIGAKMQRDVTCGRGIHAWVFAVYPEHHNASQGRPAFRSVLSEDIEGDIECKGP